MDKEILELIKAYHFSVMAINKKFDEAFTALMEEGLFDESTTKVENKYEWVIKRNKNDDINGKS